MKRFFSWVAYNIGFAILIYLASNFGYLYWPIVIFGIVWTIIAFVCLAAGIFLNIAPLEYLDINQKPIKNIREYNSAAYFYPNLIIDTLLIVGAAYWAGAVLSCILLILFAICMVNVKLIQSLKVRLNNHVNRHSRI